MRKKLCIIFPTSVTIVCLPTCTHCFLFPRYQGDMYKVKTYKEITKLERNGMFVYESVPGTSVFHLEQDGTTMSFEVQGFEDSQITVELEAETEYQVFIDGASTGTMTTNLGGKLSFSVELDTNTKAEVKIVKC